MLESLSTVHRFTIADYHAMGEAGILPRDRRLELIDGQILEMSPIGPRHLAAVDRLNRIFVFACGTDAIVRVQGSIRLPPISEPEPDLLVLVEAKDFYAGVAAVGPHALLAIEVSDTSLAYDTMVKAPLYAREGIPELWVIDLQHDQLLVYRLADATHYAEPKRLTSGSISPERSPALSFDIAELLATGR